MKFIEKLVILKVRIIFFTFLMIISFSGFAQTQKPVIPSNLYGIRNPEAETDKYCGQCATVMETMPAEVGMGFVVDDKKDVYFVFTDVDYFNKLFTTPFDGIAVDIVSKDQYACGSDNKYSGSWLYKGYLTKPVFQPELKAKKEVDKDGWVRVKLFQLPAYYHKKEIELNLIILKNKYFCWYNTFYNLESGKWGLLDTGMYMDTLTEETLKEKSNLLGKRLKFEIPFAKDKYEYAAKDIKPLYDSLKLTNFDILSISIRAFSSVEGTTERNLELQKKRAESIVKALQSLQSVQFDSVKKEIIAMENWPEFYEDIIEGRYSYMNDLTKEEIKQKLNTDKALSSSLEPILKKHRKAIIILELEPKSLFKDKDPAKLKAAFDQSIANKNISEALILQREIFKRILYNEVPENYLAQLEVPAQVEFGLLNQCRLLKLIIVCSSCDTVFLVYDFA
ncbi:MAG: hypothetical protein K2X86_07530, partial [Cytophagaceae bacterium]|nr:hypothetical protein [Cytophagaceae bacterium]